MKNTLLGAFVVLLLAGTPGCGPGDGASPEQPSTPATEAGLTEAQLRDGIGPVTALELGEIDAEMAEEGASIFEMKCAACHKMDKRYVGPALQDVLARRTPAYVMNMILNPEGMLEEHPEVQAMLAQFLTPMPNQQLTQEDARAVLEYLRTAQATN